jgi:hypothetical protein
MDKIQTYLDACLKLWQKEVGEPGIGDPVPTMKKLISKAEKILSGLYEELTAEEKDKLIEEWKYEINYKEEPGEIIGESVEPWYTDFVKTNGEKQFLYYNRYRKMLGKEGRPKKSLEEMDRITDDILEYFGNPNKKDPFDRKGLIVGYVQSGKTGNFIGVINKALDVGYNFVIVLGGLHNNLRSQTQRRIDEGVVGFDSEMNRLGVGNFGGSGTKNILIKSFTTVKRDFNKNQSTVDPRDNTKRVWVVKKNKSILNNLASYFEKVARLNSQTDFVARDGRLRNLSLLIIDDEADQASVDTRKYMSKKDREESDPVAINSGIRRILARFEQKTYVGYTATPFANLFIDDTAVNKVVESDLFPKDFIVMLDKPNTYMGPFELFGTNEQDPEIPLTRSIQRDPDLKKVHLVANTDILKGDKKGKTNISKKYQESPLDIARWNSFNVTLRSSNDEYNECLEDCIGDFIDVGDGWLPRLHKKNHDPSEWLSEKNKDLPASMEDALNSFILALAARIKRGQRKQHCSMLIHVTRNTDCQTKVQQIVSNYCEKRFAEILQKNTQTLSELKALWEKDFILTSKAMKANKNFKGVVHSWDELEPFIYDSVRELTLPDGSPRVLAIHGDSNAELNYFEQPYDKEGLKVIAIGGDKLSRGLTLEGLTTSYFLRPSSMYDTLMQMGRWFGYRRGYSDLCRIYSTPELLTNYAHISHAFEELKFMFRAMKHQGKTPREFGYRILDSDVMMITSAMKMRYTKNRSLCYNGSMPQTTIFHNEALIIESNRTLLSNLIAKLSTSYGKTYQVREACHVWNKVAGNEIKEFIKDFHNHHRQPRMNSNYLTEYIEKQLGHGELTEWTVVLYSNKKKDPKINNERKIGGKDIFTVTRSLTDEEPSVLNLKALSVPGPDIFDFTDQEIQDFRDLHPSLTKAEQTARMGLELRPSNRGLIVLYPFVPTTENVTIPNFTVDYPQSAKNSEYVLGYRIHFPQSQNASSINYKINTVAQQLEIE